MSQHPELLDEPGLRRLVQVVEHYVACADDKRRDVATVAHAGAILATLS